MDKSLGYEYCGDFEKLEIWGIVLFTLFGFFLLPVFLGRISTFIINDIQKKAKERYDSQA